MLRCRYVGRRGPGCLLMVRGFFFLLFVSICITVLLMQITFMAIFIGQEIQDPSHSLDRHSRIQLNQLEVNRTSKIHYDMYGKLTMGNQVTTMTTETKAEGKSEQIDKSAYQNSEHRTLKDTLQRRRIKRFMMESNYVQYNPSYDAANVARKIENLKYRHFGTNDLKKIHKNTASGGHSENSSFQETKLEPKISVKRSLNTDSPCCHNRSKVNLRNKVPKGKSKRKHVNKSITGHKASVSEQVAAVELHNLDSRTDEEWDPTDDWTLDQLIPSAR